MRAKKRIQKRKRSSTNPAERRFEIYVLPEHAALINQISQAAKKKQLSTSQLILTVLNSWLIQQRQAV